MKQEALGIPEHALPYMEMPEGKNTIADQYDAYMGIRDFINVLISKNIVPEFQGKEHMLQFINYGETQLVFVLYVDDRKYTLLVNQPKTPFGTAEKEYANLSYLSNYNRKNVVRPIYHFSNSAMTKELYVTPYYYQARCIGIEEKNWGVWKPEPEYLFYDFNDNDKKVMTSSMVALLIKFFNEREQLGVSKCRLDSGDFMIEKEYENYLITPENVIKKMKLIAARDMVQMPIDQYIYRLKDELLGRIDNENLLILGKKLVTPMDIDDIENGIKLGFNLKARDIEER